MCIYKFINYEIKEILALIEISLVLIPFKTHFGSRYNSACLLQTRTFKTNQIKAW